MKCDCIFEEYNRVIDYININFIEDRRKRFKTPTLPNDVFYREDKCEQLKSKVLSLIKEYGIEEEFKDTLDKFDKISEIDKWFARTLEELESKE